eukprot:scaffold12657_cov66-Cyclotella_meneghiniana.AAC.4
MLTLTLRVNLRKSGTFIGENGNFAKRTYVCQPSTATTHHQPRHQPPTTERLPMIADMPRRGKKQQRHRRSTSHFSRRFYSIHAIVR